MCTGWTPIFNDDAADRAPKPPPFHGDETRTFHTSNFREVYRATEAPKFQHELLRQVAVPRPSS